jgi:uncharacterized protein with gpF-like domain
MARRPAFISHSREREAQIQSRLLDRLEGQHRRFIAAEIERESLRLVSAYRDLGYVPSLSEDHAQAMRAIYRALAMSCARAFGQRIVTRGKAMGHALETKEEEGFFSRLFRTLALQWVQLEPIRRRIQSVTETTRTQIVNLVAKGQDEGMGVDEIARSVTDRVPIVSRQRAALIARTETHGAANYSAQETAKASGLELVKEWVSVEDARTRSIARDDAFDHASMDGQVREMDEPFDMPWVGGGGEPLKIMYPGEAGKPGGAVINCRCAVVHDVKD